MPYSIPLNLSSEIDAGVIHAWLAARDFSAEWVSVLADGSIVVEAEIDPTELLQTFEPPPPPEDSA